MQTTHRGHGRMEPHLNKDTFVFRGAEVTSKPQSVRANANVTANITLAVLPLTQLQIRLTNPEPVDKLLVKSLDSDESYQLNVSHPVAVITANTM